MGSHPKHPIDREKVGLFPDSRSIGRLRINVDDAIG